MVVVVQSYDDDGGDGDGGAVGDGSGIDDSEKEIPKLSIYTSSRSYAPSGHILVVDVVVW